MDFLSRSILRLGKPSEEKNLLLFGIFPKGGGGSCLNPNVLRNFFVLFMFGHFSERGGGGLPNTKLFEELFCLRLEVFQCFGLDIFQGK